MSERTLGQIVYEMKNPDQVISGWHFLKGWERDEQEDAARQLAIDLIRAYYKTESTEDETEFVSSSEESADQWVHVNFSNGYGIAIKGGTINIGLPKDTE